MKRLFMLAQTLRHRCGLLVADQHGVSAIEFALLLPVMITLYLGCVEITQAISINRKVTLTARTVADLVSQATSISDSDMTNVLTASSSIVSPHSASPLRATVSSVAIDAKGKATIAWSNSATFDANGTATPTWVAAPSDSAHKVGAPVTLPIVNNQSPLTAPNTTLIWSEVQYAYAPTVGYVITGTLMLKDQLYMAPRLSTCVIRPPTVTSCP